eukprot:3167156-Karenia_brevis.AAC.1
MVASSMWPGTTALTISKSWGNGPVFMPTQRGLSLALKMLPQTAQIHTWVPFDLRKRNHRPSVIGIALHDSQ